MKRIFMMILVCCMAALLLAEVDAKLLKKANAGDSEAQNSLGVLDNNSEGVSW